MSPTAFVPDTCAGPPDFPQAGFLRPLQLPPRPSPRSPVGMDMPHMALCSQKFFACQQWHLATRACD